MDNKEVPVVSILGHLVTFANVSDALIYDVGILAMRYAACGARKVGCMNTPIRVNRLLDV